MFAVEVRDHIMIAHSFQGEMFGPARALHGATFVVDARICSQTLDENGVVVDIGLAKDTLKRIVEPFNYQNLDNLPEFSGKNTTTEFMAKKICDDLSKIALSGELGRNGTELQSIRITLSESHVARAWYEASLNES